MALSGPSRYSTERWYSYQQTIWVFAKCRYIEIEGRDHDSPLSISVQPALDFISFARAGRVLLHSCM